MIEQHWGNWTALSTCNKNETNRTWTRDCIPDPSKNGQRECDKKSTEEKTTECPSKIC